MRKTETMQKIDMKYFHMYVKEVFGLTILVKGILFFTSLDMKTSKNIKEAISRLLLHVNSDFKGRT